MGEYIKTWNGRMIYRRSKEEIAAAKAKKAAKAMHCQCCGRAIFAETGTIAHHGYERPGGGYQTASCMGAKFLPFEVSRDRLGDLIEALVNREEQLVRRRAEADREEIPVRVVHVNYHAPRVKDPMTANSRGKHPTVTLDFTRANFENLIDENTGRAAGKVFDEYTAHCMKFDGFDKVKARDLKNRDAEIKGVREHLAECRARYDAWKATARWTGVTWEPITTEAK